MTLTILSAAREVNSVEEPTMETLAKAISSGSKEQGQPRIITAGKGRTGRYRHQQNQFFGSHGGKPQGGDPVEMREHRSEERRVGKECRL